MRARRLTAIAVVTAAGLFGACGGSGDTGSAERPSASTAGGSSPLAFTSPAIGGGTVDGGDFRGRPTLLWFWSPW